MRELSALALRWNIRLPDLHEEVARGMDIGGNNDGHFEIFASRVGANLLGLGSKGALEG